MLIHNMQMSDFHLEEKPPYLCIILHPKVLKSGAEMIEAKAENEHVPIQNLGECLGQHMVA